MNAKAILIVAVIIGLAAGIASAPSDQTTPRQVVTLADFTDPVLEAQFNASVRELRQLEQAEREQASEARDVRDAYSAYVSGVLSRGTSRRGLAMLAGNIESPTAYYPMRRAGSAYTQGVEATAPIDILPMSRASDRSSASRGYIDHQSGLVSGSPLGTRKTFEVELFPNPTQTNTGITNVRSGEYYAPAGPSGYVNTRDGRYYSGSGQNGVIDTRTGKYIPTN